MVAEFWKASRRVCEVTLLLHISHLSTVAETENVKLSRQINLAGYQAHDAMYNFLCMCVYSDLNHYYYDYDDDYYYCEKFVLQPKHVTCCFKPFEWATHKT